MNREHTNKLLTFLLFSILLTNNFVVFGQTGRNSGSKPQVAKSEKKAVCNGGWSGVVTYKKTLKDSLESDEPGIRKEKDRLKHRTSRDYNYTGRAIIDGTDPKQPIVNTKVNLTDNDLNWGEERIWDSCGAWKPEHWFIIESTDDRRTQAQVSGSAEYFNLSVDEMSGSYNFSMKFPKAQGVYKREQHVKRSGHCQPKNNEPYDKSDNEPTKIDGASFTVDSQKIDPNNPDVLTGTKIWGDDGKGQVRGFVFQVTWRFTRCPQKLLITDLKFEHPKFPNFDDWKEIENPTGTIDGNKIKVTATVLNMSAETKYADLKIAETYKGDKYNYARPDEPLPQGEISLRLDAGEEREVELIWDSEGQSWFDDGRPHLFHRIKAELSENNQKKDEKEKPLNIAPKPVVLVHGLWEDHKVWEPLYQNLLTLNHSYQWKAFAIGDKAGKGVMRMGKWNGSDRVLNSVYDNADQLAKYVKNAQIESNAWHIDMVAHSTGGLVARLYLHKLMPNVPDARPQVKHLVMLGTPNNGVPCIDVFIGKLGMFKTEQLHLSELTNASMLDFNKYVVNNGGAKLSALAGNSVPIICGGMEWNDGFVPVKSAIYGVADNAQSNDLNHQLVNDKNFGNFVKPHLITGPKKTYPYEIINDPTDWKRWQINSRDYDVNTGSGFYNSNSQFENSLAINLFEETRKSGPNIENLEDNQTISDEIDQTFSKELKLAPKQTVEIEIPLEAAPNFGITFTADPGVSVSLLNDKGVLVSRNLKDSPLAHMMFRMIMTNRPVSKSVWKLKLENTTDFEQVFMGFGWSTETPLSGGKPVAE